ncbi:hypothetical protein [Rummeliibacillus pycnus]|uniref:hypothetical protein n=1 Tax=Rummeliibacillus pycnus TaxID=101070 RepID=UPI0014729A4F|nr:hypothetical protein [Rummeliibacillus pycnus]
MFLFACNSEGLEDDTIPVSKDSTSQDSQGSNQSLDDTTTESNKDLTNYPEGVQSGTISPEFYDEVAKFVETELGDYSKQIAEEMDKYKNNSAYFSDQKEKDYLYQLANKANNNLLTIYFHPKSTEDKMLYDALMEYRSSRTKAYEKLKQFAEGKDNAGIALYKLESRTTYEKLNEVTKLIMEFKLNDLK